MDISKTLEQHRLWLAGEGGSRANLMGFPLSGASLRGADLRGGSLGGADLSRAYLREANLSGADLSGADLSEANLRHADLRGANLGDADLEDADLSGANLGGANLGGADLSGANLHEADLSRANLHGADLSEAYGIICAGTDPRGYRFVGISWAGGPRILAGCRWFTYAKAIAHWTAKGNADALARVGLIAVHFPPVAVPVAACPASRSCEPEAKQAAA